MSYREALQRFGRLYCGDTLDFKEIVKRITDKLKENWMFHLGFSALLILIAVVIDILTGVSILNEKSLLISRISFSSYSVIFFACFILSFIRAFRINVTEDGKEQKNTFFDYAINKQIFSSYFIISILSIYFLIASISGEIYVAVMVLYVCFVVVLGTYLIQFVYEIPRMQVELIHDSTMKQEFWYYSIAPLITYILMSFIFYVLVN